MSALIADSAYMCQEVDRFHALLKTAGDKWGGGKEMSEQVRTFELKCSAGSPFHLIVYIPCHIFLLALISAFIVP